MTGLRSVLRGVLVATALALLPLPGAAQQTGAPTIILNQAEGGRDRVDGDALLARARAQGRLAVIVGFDAGPALAGELSRQAARAQDAQVGTERARVLRQAGIRGAREYAGLPFFSLDATPEQLRRLL
jgi:hypothetical protein